MTEAKYTISELAKLAGVTVRTIRYYISQGLLPAPGSAGPGEKYDDSYLQRLDLIKRLKAEYLPLEKIKDLLANVAEDVIREEAGEAPAQPLELAPDSAKEYLRNILSPTRPVKQMQRMAETQNMYAPDSLYLRESTASRSAVPPAQLNRLERSSPPGSEERWLRYRVCDDVELHIRERADPRIRRRLADMLKELERLCHA
ncbi:MAG: MerR family transcriptional regulator [Anaerolineae bacterium]